MAFYLKKSVFSIIYKTAFLCDLMLSSSPALLLQPYHYFSNKRAHIPLLLPTGLCNGLAVLFTRMFFLQASEGLILFLLQMPSSVSFSIRSSLTTLFKNEPCCLPDLALQFPLQVDYFPLCICLYLLFYIFIVYLLLV